MQERVLAVLSDDRIPRQKRAKHSKEILISAVPIYRIHDSGDIGKAISNQSDLLQKDSILACFFLVISYSGIILNGGNLCPGKKESM